MIFLFKEKSDDYVKHGKFSYYIESQFYAKDYNIAKEKCTKKRMQLAMIKDKETLNFLISEFDQNPYIGKCYENRLKVIVLALLLFVILLACRKKRRHYIYGCKLSRFFFEFKFKFAKKLLIRVRFPNLHF